MPKFGPYKTTTSTDDEAQVNATSPQDRWTPDRPMDVSPDDHALWLPHSCDEWIIAQGDRETVIARGREFIASVEAALNWLEQDGPGAE